MSQWDYVILAYAVTLVGVAALAIASFRAMRRAEKRVSELGSARDGAGRD